MMFMERLMIRKVGLPKELEKKFEEGRRQTEYAHEIRAWRKRREEAIESLQRRIDKEKDPERKAELIKEISGLGIHWEDRNI